MIFRLPPWRLSPREAARNYKIFKDFLTFSFQLSIGYFLSSIQYAAYYMLCYILYHIVYMIWPSPEKDSSDNKKVQSWTILELSQVFSVFFSGQQSFSTNCTNNQNSSNILYNPVRRIFLSGSNIHDILNFLSLVHDCMALYDSHSSHLPCPHLVLTQFQLLDVSFLVHFLRNRPLN